MAIELSNDGKQRAIASIKRYFTEHLDDEIGELKASLLLDFCLKEIGPTIYNRAIAEAQLHLQERVAELDGPLYEEEFGYWPDSAKSSDVRRRGGKEGS